jgi:hypothetical protein
MYLNGSLSHAGLTIVCPGTGAGIGAVGISTVGAAGVKCSDLGGGTAKVSGIPDCTGMAECTEMSECTGMASRMGEPTGIVKNRAKMAESS